MNGTTSKPLHIPGRKVCGTCLRVLDYNESYGVWQHPSDMAFADHPAQPVDDTEVPAVEEKCDFCFAPSTEWILPAADFEVAPNHGSVGDWGACAECGELIKADNWPALIQRVKDSWPGALGEGISAEGEMWLRRTYKVLRRKATGPLVRIQR